MARVSISSLLIGSALLLAGLSAGSASAQDAPSGPVDGTTAIDPIDIPPERDPLAHAWDRPRERGGFYLRGSMGLGVHSARLGPPSWENDGGGSTARGFGTGFGLDLGAMLAPWIALHLDTHIGVLWSGSVDYDLAIASGAPGDMRITAYGFAPAATFFVPHDFFFTTAFGAGFARMQAGDSHNVTDPGFFMNLGAGKDLYRDDHVAVGLQMQVAYMLLGDKKKENEARIREFLFGVSIAYDSI